MLIFFSIIGTEGGKMNRASDDITRDWKERRKKRKEKRKRRRVPFEEEKEEGKGSLSAISFERM